MTTLSIRKVNSMARTLNGNLAGRASHMTLDERMDMLGETKQEKFLRLLDEIRAIDPDFETWWDSIEAPSNYAMIPMMEERIESIINTPADWPWTAEDLKAELDNRRPEVGF